MRPRSKQLRSVAGTDGQVLTVQADNLSIAPENAAGGGGAVTGTRTLAADFTNDISGTTAPTPGTLGTGTDTADYPDGSTTGQRIEFNIPVDYDSGDLTFLITYRMSTTVASPNNQVRVETAVELAKASDGTFDTTTYPATAATHVVPDNSTAIVRETFLTITEGDFAGGDSIQVLFKRLGADGADLHTGAFRAISYEIQYTGAVATSSLMDSSLVFNDTDETAPDPGTLGNFDTIDFNPSVDNEQKFAFTVPDNWDESSDIHITLLFAMSTAESAKVVRIATEGDIIDVVAGTTNTLPVLNIDIPTKTTTDITRSGAVRTISSSDINRGDRVTVFLARRGTATEDTHLGDFKLLHASVHVGIAPQSGFTAVEQQSLYLEQHDFNPVSGSGVSGDISYPDFGGDFETYVFMESTIVSGRIDVSFQGRLSDGQTSVSSISVPIKGTSGSQYQLKVFVEGSGASPVYDSTLLAAPTTRTVTTLTSGDLSAQPTGEGRYYVVVEATLDAAETLSVGRPYVKQA